VIPRTIHHGPWTTVFQQHVPAQHAKAAGDAKSLADVPAGEALTRKGTALQKTREVHFHKNRITAQRSDRPVGKPQQPSITTTLS